MQEALARPYPGLVEDLEFYFRHEVRAGRVRMDAEAAAALRESIGKLDESSLSGPDQAAWHRLRREIDGWSRMAP